MTKLVPPIHPESTPPETPVAMKRFPRGPESLLPPRNAPSAALSVALIGMASAAATDTSMTGAQRACVIAALALVAWVVGYFTQPPRRQFRRGDR